MKTIGYYNKHAEEFTHSRALLYLKHKLDSKNEKGVSLIYI